MPQIPVISDEEEEEENLDDQDERGNLKDFINDEEEGEEDEGSDSVDSEDDVGNRSRKRSESLCQLRLGAAGSFAVKSLASLRPHFVLFRVF